MTVAAAFAYDASATPPGYVCDTCGARGVRLYRRYQTFLENQRLYCTGCAAKDQNRPANPDRPDSIGWLVAAVPTEDNSTYWGFTSVPDAGVSWWRRLPVQA